MKTFVICYILNQLKTYQVLQVERPASATCQRCVRTLSVCHTCGRTRAPELHLGPHLMLVSP